ncbi:hypothetical protein HPB50_027071 [Hyalomma asiaticum]|uniref:Uncharacterized protein n=1 Tax=Hyalomma asiaticum TaxID=266040 RepID=A0ACB7RR66_HYAAI|nr:hypothetical protein HPB50_027071 [Hyalomma asiaticum]
MATSPGAPSPCDDFYGYVCLDFERSGAVFLDVLRLQRKTDYHESMLAVLETAPTGDPSHMLAYAHQICAQFSHRQNPSLRTMASQMRLSMENDIKDFLEARTDHNATMHALTWAAVRMGINTLFNVTESIKTRRLQISARHASQTSLLLPDQYRFGLSDKRLLVHVDNLLRYLWRNKATDFVLQAIVKLAKDLSKLSFENDSGTDVEKLEHYVLPPGDFRIGEMIVSSVPRKVNLRHNVKATIFYGDVISQAEAVLRDTKRETANLFLLVLFFDEYMQLVTGSQQTYEESLSCTLLGAKLFPLQYGASEAALFYNKPAAGELREMFENAKVSAPPQVDETSSPAGMVHIRTKTGVVTAASHLGVKAQTVDINLNILENNTFRTDRQAERGTTLYPSHARNIVEGLKATMSSMLRRVAEGKYGGESRSLVEAQLRGTFDFDERVSSLLVATQNLLPPFYCLEKTTSKLSMGINDTVFTIDCDGGRFKPFLNYGLAATATVEAVLSYIIQNLLHNATDIEERAACYRKQLHIHKDTKVDAATLVRNALGLSLSFAMLTTSNMALWRDLRISGESRAAMQLFFYRHCLRHCGKRGTLTGEHMCHLALINMPDFFTAYGCWKSAPLWPHLQCDI